MNAAALNLPTDEEVEAAQAAVEALRDVAVTSQPTILRLRSAGHPAEVEVKLPGEALHLLVRVLSHLANGHAVTVLPVEAELTTQQAADLLGVSRPYLVRLLDDGIIHFRKVGTHRRVRAADLVGYEQRDDEERREAADALAAEARDLDLGY